MSCGRPSLLAKRASQSLQEIGRSSPFRAAVVVGHFDAFHGCASQEKGGSKPIKTFSKVCLFMKLDAVLKNGVWVLAVPAVMWLEFRARRSLRATDGIGSSCEINRLIDGRCGEALPAIDLAHVDLAGSK